MPRLCYNLYSIYKFVSVLFLIVSADTQFKCRGLCSVPNPVELRCDKLPSNRRGQMARYSISVQFKLKKISAISTKKKRKYGIKGLNIHYKHPWGK